MVSSPAADNPYYQIIEAASPDDREKVVNLGVRHVTMQRATARHRRTLVAQYFGIVRDVRHAQHLFQGLNRPLLDGDDMKGDQGVLIYSWRPTHDYLWIGSQFDGSAAQVTPPARRVFVVLARQYKEPDEHGVIGSIEHWTWVEEGTLPGTPVDWNARYARKIW